jgi:hypothetical protein
MPAHVITGFREFSPAAEGNSRQVPLAPRCLSFRQDQLSLARDLQPIELAVMLDPDLGLSTKNLRTQDSLHRLGGRACETALATAPSRTHRRARRVLSVHASALIDNRITKARNPAINRKV